MGLEASVKVRIPRLLRAFSHIFPPCMEKGAAYVFSVVKGELFS